VEQSNPVLSEEVVGLPLFVGEFTHSLDPKKRLTIPAVWRAQVGAPRSVFVMPDFFEKCLNVYPATNMAHKLEKLRATASISDRKAMAFASRLGAASELVSWDSQGRIRIRDQLLNFAGIQGQIVMVGALDKFQLWSRELRPPIEEIDQQSLLEAGKEVLF